MDISTKASTLFSLALGLIGYAPNKGSSSSVKPRTQPLPISQLTMAKS